MQTVEEEQEEVGVLVLDSFYSIMVVYTDMGTLGIPWPLPPDSPLSR